MIIQCPKCGFSREVPEDKVPAASSVATCPKCAHKFKFREISKVTRLRDYREGQDEAAAAGRQARSGEPGGPGVQDASDAAMQAGEQPGAEAGASRSDQAPEQASGQPRRNAHARPANARPAEGDIWQRLESMRPGRPEETGQDEREVPAADEELPKGSLSDEDVARGVPSIDAPWERMDKFGFVGGFAQTVKRVMLNPQAFFACLPLKGIARPLAFFLLVGFVQLAAQLLWGAAGMTFMDLVSPQAEPQATTSLGEGGYLLLVIFPFILLALLFAVSGLNHLFLMATKAARRGFEATFRAVAYGSAPLVLSVIPYAGDMLGLIWNLAVTIIAYKYIHRTSYTRVALAMLIPFAFMFALGLLSLNAK